MYKVYPFIQCDVYLFGTINDNIPLDIDTIDRLGLINLFVILGYVNSQ